MEIKKKYRRGWFNIFEREEMPFRDIDVTKLKTPFNHLPERLYLTKEEKEVLALYRYCSEKNKKSENSPAQGPPIIWYMMLDAKEVCNEENFQVGLSYFQKLLKNCKEQEIELPQSFIQFFQTLDFQARFRKGDLRFNTWEGLTPFPDNPNYYITPFFGNSQGFCWWYLLLNKDSEYCILYNDYHWREIGNQQRPGESAPEFIICADSFEEFIIRLTEDIKNEEEGKWEENFKARFSQYFSISPKELLEQFPEERKLLKKDNLPKNGKY